MEVIVRLPAWHTSNAAAVGAVSSAGLDALRVRRRRGCRAERHARRQAPTWAGGAAVSAPLRVVTRVARPEAAVLALAPCFDIAATAVAVLIALVAAALAGSGRRRPRWAGRRRRWLRATPLRVVVAVARAEAEALTVTLIRLADVAVTARVADVPTAGALRRWRRRR